MAYIVELQTNKNTKKLQLMGANGIGNLQRKTIAPKMVEQIVVQDEEYYGLKEVTVEAIPKIPACVASVFEDTEIVCKTGVEIAAAVSVAAEIYVQTHAKYGSVRLPLLPEDVLAAYPYCWIWKDTDTAEYKAFFSTAIWYFNRRVSGGDLMYRTVSETSPVYVYSQDADKWEFLQDHSSNQKIGVYNSGSIVWTNFDVPNGSATATSYFKTATEPGLTV